MADPVSLAVIGIGTAVSSYGAMAQAKASAKAEKLRQRMMNLEAMRKRREIIREGVVARAAATSSAVAQGAGEGSALRGGIAQITGQQDRNLVTSKQDQDLGNKVFKSNQQYAKAGGIVAFGQGLSSFGSSFGGS